MKVGDLVTRRSHGHDVVFKVICVHPDGNVRLKGHHWRLEADAPMQDLSRATYANSTETWVRTRESMVTAKQNLHPRVNLHSLIRSTSSST